MTIDDRERGVSARLSAEGRAMRTTDALLAGLAGIDYGDDVEMLIRSAVHEQRAFRESVGKALPRARQARARRLLATYDRLQGLAAKAPRDPSGVLLRQDALTGGLVPWVDPKVRHVSEIPVFSRANIMDWLVAVAMAMPAPKRRKAVPRRREQAKRPTTKPAAKVPPVPPGSRQGRDVSAIDATRQVDWERHNRALKASGFAPDPTYVDPRTQPKTESGPAPVTVMLIKTPGMSFATPAGRTLVYAAVLRALAHGQLDEARSVAIVRSALGDPGTAAVRESLKQQFDLYLVGQPFTMQPHRLLFEALAKVPEFAGFDPTRFTDLRAQSLGQGFTEFYPAHTTAERACFAALQIDRIGSVSAEGYVRGQRYFDNVIYLGAFKPENTGTPDDQGEMEGYTHSLWYLPDGRIVHRYSKRLTHAEGVRAFHAGVLGASGSVTLAWVTFAVGAAAFAAGALGGGLAGYGLGGSSTAAPAAAEPWVNLAADKAWAAFVRVSPNGVTVFITNNVMKVFIATDGLIGLGQSIAERGLDETIRILNPLSWESPGDAVACLMLLLPFYEARLTVPDVGPDEPPPRGPRPPATDPGPAPTPPPAPAATKAAVPPVDTAPAPRPKVLTSGKLAAPAAVRTDLTDPGAPTETPRPAKSQSVPMRSLQPANDNDETRAFRKLSDIEARILEAKVLRGLRVIAAQKRNDVPMSMASGDRGTGPFGSTAVPVPRTIETTVVRGTGSSSRGIPAGRTGDRSTADALGGLKPTPARGRALEVIAQLPPDLRSLVITRLRAVDGRTRSALLARIAKGDPKAIAEAWTTGTAANDDVGPASMPQRFDPDDPETPLRVQAAPVVRRTDPMTERIQADRSTLRTRMLKWFTTGQKQRETWMGADDTDWDAHHVFPVALQDDDVFVVLRATKGWDHNDPERNGIALPNKSELVDDSGLALHQVTPELQRQLVDAGVLDGLSPDLRFHPVYTSKVEVELSRLHHLLGSPDQLMSAVMDLKAKIIATMIRGKPVLF